jgi:hypothetical protein
MDTLYWKSKNSSIRFEETTKQFFGKYLYRVRLEVHGGRIIVENTDYAKAIEARRQFRNFNPGGYWGRPVTSDLDKIDTQLLSAIRTVKDKHPDVKMRIEEPEVQFYAETEDDLKNIMDYLGPDYHNIVLSISGPANAEAQRLLESGVIIRKKKIGYNYKIVLRDGRCEVATKQQILNYLENLGLDEVKVSPGVKNMLDSKYNGFWSIWFYANDEKVTIFLELIHPGCVLNIHPVVVA